MNSDSPSRLSRWLNLLAVAVVAFYLVVDCLQGMPPWIAALGILSLAAWLVVIFLPRRMLRSVGVLTLVMLVGGALATVPTNGLMIVPAAVAVMRVAPDLRRPVWHGLGLGLGGAAIIAVGVFISPLPPLGLISIEGGLAVATLAGVSRRQFRAAELQTREMLEEQARALALAQRQNVARDIHDVLAHSLGGLVVQLDAVEALLEAGRPTDAAVRVHDARALAVSGLTEARRAVDALREDGQQAEPIDLTVAVEDLARAHRSLGGVLDLEVAGDPHPLQRDEAAALSRLLQESLTNARKHAPGEPVHVALRWSPGGVELEAMNPLGAPGALAASGGGRGLQGMAERFRALPGSTFSADTRSAHFVVSASVGER